MIWANIVWGAPVWGLPAVLVAATALLVIGWVYWRTPAAPWLRACAASLKAIGILALSICLIEPLFSGTRPRPKANLFFMLADNSQSLQVRDRGSRETRGDQLKRQLTQQTKWQTRLDQDFDVRRYLFDRRPQPVVNFSSITLDGSASSLANSLDMIARRYEGRANAGILLFTDGNATDFADRSLNWPQLPPIYPVMLGEDAPAKDISVTRISVGQTNFESAPVTIVTDVRSHGFTGQAIVVQLLDETGKEVQRQIIQVNQEGKPAVLRFRLRPEKSGISFYRVRAFAQSEKRLFQAPQVNQPQKSAEATLVNNERLAMVDRGGGPYRVLYVCGRPNWEFKFLRRAIEEDDEVNLVGLVRIAKREPKFTFRGRAGESTNPIFRGFGNQDDEQAEQYDQPVLLRMGTIDEDELRDGFPKATDQLFRYHAVILDDLESGYFTRDQMSLVQAFVSQRGGGLLMLGGQGSFAGGKYEHTPIGEMLPVYLDRPRDVPSEDSTYQLSLTREGWLQPWVRLRATEQDEDKRLSEMPKFKTLNRTQSIKPGATVLAHVTSSDGQTYPALVAQRFGKGRAAALLIGDMWRWNLRQKRPEESDLQKAWRQTVRWLVADVPQRIEVETSREDNSPSLPVKISVRVRDAMFKPLDNATVVLHVKTPAGKDVELTAGASDRKAGLYQTTFVPRTPGAYRAKVVVTAADGSPVGQRETGWTSEPATDEFRVLVPNRALLERMAEKTGGEMVAADGLQEFVSSLPGRKIPVTEPWVFPLWHQWNVFLFAVACLIGEWGLRRWKGLP